MKPAATVLQSTHLSFSEFAGQSGQWKNSVLGSLCFSHPSQFAGQDNFDHLSGPPFIQVPMSIIDGADCCCEIWRSQTALTQGQRGAVRYRCDNETLFGVMVMPEVPAAPSEQNQQTPLQHATESAYRQIFALLDELDYPFVLRFWNYMADINGTSHGLERYHQFTLGRQDAFLACGREVIGKVPAACALGYTPAMAQNPLIIAVLAGRTAPLAIENPRQMSAYRYPLQYGPRSPSFSRASLVSLGQDALLFISGTASIVGHETLHAKDVVAQTRETLANIKAVLDEANRQSGQPLFNLANLYYRVYVRHVADMLLIREEMQRSIGAEFKAVFLQADICRPDLLLEIEATAGHSLTLSGAGRGKP